LVFIAAPHTSNWDTLFMVACAWTLRLDIRWLGKSSLFRPRPFGWLMRALGGIPVERGTPQQTVARIAEEFRSRETLLLGISPEGTRSAGDRWKSGFYHIAREAGVPIGFGFLDFARKRGGLGGILVPTGDVRADMDRVRAFYADIRGKRPRLQIEPRIKDEDAAALSGD
jgi:1-acyl-sn-glycerol-3-phosphate acyltransferase